MSEFEDKINAILSDSDQMEKISRLASQLMGGEAQNGGGTMPDISGLMQSFGAANSEKTALLNAISPYISKKRAAKLQKAMRFAQLAHLAGTAFSERGGE